jgi:hypothetical protein
MIFGEEEKAKFRELLVSYAGFSGITVAAWCLMDNHFHLLLHVPARERENPAGLPEKNAYRDGHFDKRKLGQPRSKITCKLHIGTDTLTEKG